MTIARHYQPLIDLLGADTWSMEHGELQHYSHDASFHDPHAPDIVIWPQTTKDVSRVLRFASIQCIPVTAWGGGSSLEGNPIPVSGGIVLDMRRMSRILSVNSEDMTVTVQPGIIGDELNVRLKPAGLLFPAQPGSGNVATLGGMIANNAGGMQAVRYGVVGDWVLQLEVVLATGEVIRVGSRSFKSVAGYDLKRLFIASEGTLGVITEIVLKVAPLPAYRATFVAAFPTVADAGSAIQDVLHQGLQPASLELMDAYNIVLLNRFKQIGWEELPTVIVEFHEKEPLSDSVMEQLERIVAAHQGRMQVRATDDQKRMEIWKARWSVRPAIRALYPDMGIIPGDIGIPLSNISGYLDSVQALSRKFAIQAVTFGHAGDGNFHTWILYTVGNQKSLEKAKKFAEAVVEYAIFNGGTCTAEHGIGIGKRKYLPKEHPTDIAWMKKIKQLFDPQGILNPGKMFL